ncbi:MAG TPA: type II toxin-antitoxin system HicB family antitoxin [Caldisericia bacterium]|mgnify:CR=1 FL=1|nr:type II toxin-antitoxin system HicB family antitoxin [Caldisericia bacterium]
MNKYLIIIEKANRNFSAYSPDLPGCIATGKTRKEVEKTITEAIQIHLEGLKEDNLQISESTATAEYVVIN